MSNRDESLILGRGIPSIHVPPCHLRIHELARVADTFMFRPLRNTVRDRTLSLRDETYPI